MSVRVRAPVRIRAPLRTRADVRQPSNSHFFYKSVGAGAGSGVGVKKKKHALLLDVDGVIVRNEALLKHVANKCVTFVREFSAQPLTHIQAKEYNKTLYTTYGHTLRGIHKSWSNDDYDNCNGEDAQDAIARLYAESARLFDEIVYDGDTITMLEQYLSTSEFVDHSAQIADLCLLCKAAGTPVFLFSNAPEHWCVPVAEKLERLYGEPLISDVLSTGHAAFAPFLHKPDKQLYANVEKQVAQYVARRVGAGRGANIEMDRKLLFVDDSFINLVPIINNPDWVPVLYGANENQTRVQHRSVCHMVHTIEWLMSYIASSGRKQKAKKQYNVMLHGGPFVKVNTVKRLLLSCVGAIEDEAQAEAIANHANTTGSALVATCDEDTAYKYCQNLIENGLYATIE